MVEDILQRETVGEELFWIFLVRNRNEKNMAWIRRPQSHFWAQISVIKQIPVVADDKNEKFEIETQPYDLQE